MGVLILCTGLLAGFFFWYAQATYSELDLVKKPASLDITGRRISNCSSAPLTAKDPVSSVCEQFDSPCDVPAGWMKVPCDLSEEVAPAVMAASSSVSSTPVRESVPAKRKPDPKVKLLP